MNEPSGSVPSLHGVRTAIDIFSRMIQSSLMPGCWFSNSLESFGVPAHNENKMDANDYYKSMAEDYRSNFESLRVIEWHTLFQAFGGYAAIAVVHTYLLGRFPSDPRQMVCICQSTDSKFCNDDWPSPTSYHHNPLLIAGSSNNFHAYLILGFRYTNFFTFEPRRGNMPPFPFNSLQKCLQKGGAPWAIRKEY